MAQTMRAKVLQDFGTHLNSCSVETWGFGATLGLCNSWFLQNMSLDRSSPEEQPEINREMEREIACVFGSVNSVVYCML